VSTSRNYLRLTWAVVVGMAIVFGLLVWSLHQADAATTSTPGGTYTQHVQLPSDRSGPGYCKVLAGQRVCKHQGW
jgi:hypothetical protein